MRPITLSLLVTLLLCLLPHARAQLTPKLILSNGIEQRTPHIVFSPNGKTTLVTQFNGTAIFLETATGRTLNTIDFGHDRYTAPYVPIYASDETAYFLTEERVLNFDIPSFSFGRDLNIQQPSAHIYDPSSNTYYIAGKRGERTTIWTLDPNNGRSRPFYISPQTTFDPITRISLAPREKLALLTYKSGTSELLRTGPRWVVAKTYPASTDHRVLLPDGRILSHADGFNPTFALSNPADSSAPLTIAFPRSTLIKKILTPDAPGKPILLATYDTLFELDPKTNQLTPRRTFLQADGVNGAQINTIAATADHSTLFAQVYDSQEYSDTFIQTPASNGFFRWESAAFHPKTIDTSSTTRTFVIGDGEDLYKIVAINPSGLTITSQKKRPNLDTVGRGLHARPAHSPPQKIVLIHSNKRWESTIRAVEAQTGKPLWERTHHVEWYGLNPEDNTVVFLTEQHYSSDTATGERRYRKHTLHFVDIATGKNVREPHTIVAKVDHPSVITVSSDGQRWVFQEGKTLRTYTLPNLDQPEEINLTRSLAKGDFLPGDKHLVAIVDDNIAFFDVEASKHLGDLSLMQTDTRWAFVTPDGLFDAPVPAQSALNFAFGLTPAPLTSFYEPFFRPRLLDDLLEGRELAPSNLDVTQLTVPPSTKTSLLSTKTNSILDTDTTEQNEVTLNVAIASGGTPLRELRIFHNGKRLSLATRGLFVEDDEPDAASATPSYNQNRQIPLQLLPGDNTITVVALNAQNIESEPTELKINLKADPNQTQPTLHLVAVGIDLYQNEKYNLNYAVADASAFADTLQKNATQLFSAVNYYPIKNNDAIKQTLVSTLERIKQTAKPSDVFIFYYAGHGVVAKQGQGDFYIVPHDVTQLYGADDQLQGRALSSDQLQELSSQISAQKQLFILDACQSAGALTGIKNRGAAEERAIAQLARSTGTHWLTASGSQQFATEFAELGHGAFTYTLLQALQGKADSGDGRVTVNELKAYLESQVPEVTAKHKGTAQYPASYGYGQDFPIAILP